jgi:hypothetical protein
MLRGLDQNVKRLFLGSVAVSKGTMSEMKLSLFRQRSLEALKQRTRRDPSSVRPLAF